MKEALDEQSRIALVKYRIERANETMKESALLANEGYYNAAVNRLYTHLRLMPLLRGFLNCYNNPSLHFIQPYVFQQFAE